MCLQMYETDNFGDLVSKLCFSHYDKLVKTGKPQKGKQWTHLAAILITKQNDDCNPDAEIVSMGTGSKCIGLSARNLNGYILHDSHAEVLARRAFIRYLYYEIIRAIQHDSSTILSYSSLTKTCTLKPNINFHMFVSHTPCGDASIFPMSSATSNDIGTIINDIEQDEKSEHKRKRQKIDMAGDVVIRDIQRTGAKCVPTGPQDLHLPGADYHVTKAVRLKPGRGDPTRSLSCSDKIAKWNVVGLQGALLSHFLDRPLYLTTFIIANCPFDKTSLHRAIVERIEKVFDLPLGYKVNKPYLLQSTHSFVDGRSATSQNNDVLPCSSGIIWSAVPEKSLEVIVQGKRQGITKKAGLTDKAACSVSKKKLFDQFHRVRLEMLKNRQSTANLEIENLRTYHEWKLSATRYQQAINQLRNELTTWPTNLSTYEQFT